MKQYNQNRTSSIVWQLVAYVFAIFLAIYCYDHLPTSMNMIWKVLISNVLATVVIFFFSYAFRNASMYDPYWSIQPIIIALFLIAHEQTGVDLTRQTVVVLVILIWGIRLTWNFLRGWQGIIHEDWRYVKLRDTFGKYFLLVSFFGIMLMPTILVFLGCLPLFDALMNGHQPFGFFDVIALIICMAGIIIEWIADQQLLYFRTHRNDTSEILNTGIWKYSRHPNYFGEILFWVGIAVFGASSHGDAELIHVLGMAAMILLFNFISIPMQEKRMIERKPDYLNEIKIRSKLIPLPPQSDNETK